jgi:bcr-type benzoyl-CoA reductase subunit D
MLYTAGIDLGSAALKAVILKHGDGTPKIVARVLERLHRREAEKVAHIAWAAALEQAGLRAEDVAYVASTGEGDAVAFRTGHFFGMTTHARGAIHLLPQAKALVDIGALHARVMVVDPRGKVLRYRMTSQCASGTGQFLENIARYLGVRIDETGALSLGATRAETVSGICAVLAETDVINMVSRGIPTGEILRGIHESIAQRLARLLRQTGAESPVLLTGGLALDDGLRAAISRRLEEEGGPPLEIHSDPLSIYAGAIGAAVWGAFRYQKVVVAA